MLAEVELCNWGTCQSWIPDLTTQGTWEAHSMYNSIYTVAEPSSSPSVPLTEQSASAKEIPTLELSDRTTRIGKIITNTT